jgi:hypothetical protein
MLSFSVACNLLVMYNNHNDEHNKGLGLKTCSFKAQGVKYHPAFLELFLNNVEYPG